MSQVSVRDTIKKVFDNYVEKPITNETLFNLSNDVKHKLHELLKLDVTVRPVFEVIDDDNKKGVNLVDIIIEGEE